MATETHNIPGTYDEAVGALALWHGADPSRRDLRIWLFRDDSAKPDRERVVRLVEVSGAHAALGEARPISLGRAKDFPYQSQVILLTPEEWEMVLGDQSLRLPGGWDVDQRERCGLVLTQSDAFLQQARSDYELFLFLMQYDRDLVPECHPLHYLQMATEKLGKALWLASGQPAPSHWTHGPQYFIRVWFALTHDVVAQALGLSRLALSGHLQSLTGFRDQVYALSPAAAGPHPNVEYPWPNPLDPQDYLAPATTTFAILEVQDPALYGFIDLIHILLRDFHLIFP